jgi:hypothetical protein
LTWALGVFGVGVGTGRRRRGLERGSEIQKRRRKKKERTKENDDGQFLANTKEFENLV